jgi:hypothetical protein
VSQYVICTSCLSPVGGCDCANYCDCGYAMDNCHCPASCCGEQQRRCRCEELPGVARAERLADEHKRGAA